MKPTWEELIEILIHLATKYFNKPHADDLKFQNNSITLTCLLQYIELAYAMKHGDIGYVEATFLHWTLVFQSVRKQKYATYLIKLMLDMKYIYLKPLKHIVHMNWLVNPTGWKDGFYSVDWVVKLLNLYMKVRDQKLIPWQEAHHLCKVTYGGKGSNRTFQLVMKNSLLIETFQKVHINIWDNFHLVH
jgi:hypothetical protein